MGKIKIGMVVVCLLLLAGCTGVKEQNTLQAVPEIRPGFLQGYLEADMLPNSLALIPPPPAEGSSALALDREVNGQSLALQGTARWDLAKRDARLKFPQAAETFSCALGLPISEEEMPHLYMLLRRTIADAVLSTTKAKNHYKRTRPFVVNGEPTCTPTKEAHMKKSGSYPSGHTAIGWAWALILAEVAPEQSDAIFARGWAFGQSRIICNVHWQSDVLMGQVMGAAAVAKLHSDPAFLAEIEAAKAEVQALRAKALSLSLDCKGEAAALAENLPQASWPANR